MQEAESFVSYLKLYQQNLPNSFTKRNKIEIDFDDWNSVLLHANEIIGSPQIAPSPKWYVEFTEIVAQLNSWMDGYKKSLTKRVSTCNHVFDWELIFIF